MTNQKGGLKKLGEKVATAIVKVGRIVAIAIGVVVVLILGWSVTAWLYPDEWFADIPKAGLFLVRQLLGAMGCEASG